MTITHKTITYWKNNNNKDVSYGNLACNNEEVIIKWLHQQGFIFEGIGGTECHDIGDTDFYQGYKTTDNIDTIVAFMKKLYGEWDIDVLFNGTKIRISKMYPNIMHHLSFMFSTEREDTIVHTLERFEQEFCYPEIKEAKQYR